jgi:hypothetical protein
MMLVMVASIVRRSYARMIQKGWKVDDKLLEGKCNMSSIVT